MPSSPRIRVSFGIPELEIGGAEQQLVRLAVGLDRSIFEPSVWTLAGEGPLAAPLREAGIPLTCLGARSRWDLRAIAALTRHLRARQPDVLQTFLFRANMAGRLAARRAGVPCVLSGLRVAEPRRWQLWMERHSQRLVGRHICVSESVARHYRDRARLDPAKIAVIPNSIDAARFAEAAPWVPAGTSNRDRLILFVGRLEPQKNPELLLAAFREIAAEYPDVRLVIAGRGSLEPKLRRQSQRLGSRVLWLGPIEDVAGLMKAAHLLVLPSRWEGMPNVLLEAMAAGLPVVASAAEGAGDLLAGGNYGEIVDGSTNADLAASLRTALENGAEALVRARLAQDYVNKQFTTYQMLQSYQRLFLDVLNSRLNSEESPRQQELRRVLAKKGETLQSQPG